MYSSEDLERFYFQYQTESLPKGESLQAFCLRSNVPYNIFHKWYKDTRKKIVAVKVDGAPAASGQGSAPEASRPISGNQPDTSDSVRIWIELRMSNGLHLSQKNLSYRDLVRLVEKLEGLC